jgi:hypothetical protein
MADVIPKVYGGENLPDGGALLDALLSVARRLLGPERPA